MLLTMTVDRVGIRDFDGSWLVYMNIDTSDQLHTFRVEKHGKDFLRILMDGEELFVVGYCTLFDRNNEEASTSFGNAGAIALTMVEETAEFYHAGYRHLVGATSFPDDPSGPTIPACPTDVNGDGVTNVLDLIQLLLQFGQACEVAP